MLGLEMYNGVSVEYSILTDNLLICFGEFSHLKAIR